jgi:hypothetical protein
MESEGIIPVRAFRFAGILVLIAASVWGQSYQTQPAVPSVRAAGDAVVHARPDRARIDIGVLTEAPTAQSAATQNAAKLQPVLDRLRAALGPKSDIRTISYSVTPDYNYAGGGRTLKGYNATNTIEVTTDDLSIVGKIIDTATDAGANQIQGVAFELRDEAAARAEALGKAAVEARANVRAMAGALGLKLGRVLSVEQGVPQVIRPMAAQTVRAAGAQTQVESGTIEVRASVSLTFALE